MDENVTFDEEPRGGQTFSMPGEERGTGMTGWLLDKGIASSDRAAQVMLLSVAVGMFILAAAIIVFGRSGEPVDSNPPLDDERYINKNG